MTSHTTFLAEEACLMCEKPRKGKKFCSQPCYWAHMKTRRPEETPNWRGENAKQRSIHEWMYKNYGQESVCEGVEGMKCRGNATHFDWALKKGYEYSHDRNAFLRLCRSCHRRYDMTPEFYKRIIRNTEKFRIKKGKNTFYV